MDSIIIIPKGNSSEDIKEREKIIRHFIADGKKKTLHNEDIIYH
jgi:hypothetical protein